MISLRDHIKSIIENSDAKAIIFNIQRYCLHDGPGIRTTVFLKGCPLRCAWCANPESFNREIEIYFNESKCIYCGACKNACENDAINPDLKNTAGSKIDYKKCNKCGACVTACPARAISYMGREAKAYEVFSEILEDLPFYRKSGGGATFSGGEPLLQIDFLENILHQCYQSNINTAVETCGHVQWKNFKRIIDCIDYILYDIKHMDSASHKTLTGVDNSKILENARKLAGNRPEMIIRIPLIPGCNDDLDNIESAGDFISSISVKKVHILPYHRLGVEKYKFFNNIYPLQHLKDMATVESGRRKIKKIKKTLQSYGLDVYIGG